MDRLHGPLGATLARRHRKGPLLSGVLVSLHGRARFSRAFPDRLLEGPAAHHERSLPLHTRGLEQNQGKARLAAVSRGVLTKQKSSTGLRTTHVLASATLEELLTGHFERTRQELLELTQRLFGRSSYSTLYDRIDR